MDAVVGQLPTGIVVEPAELVRQAVLVVRDGRGGLQKQVPGDARRRVRVSDPADTAGVLVGNACGVCDRDLSDRAGSEELGRLLAIGRRAPVDADLDEALRAPRGFHHAPALVNCQR